MAIVVLLLLVVFPEGAGATMSVAVGELPRQGSPAFLGEKRRRVVQTGWP
ncbi:MAG TPA: hypothetical protein VKT82_12755 [Ktedonobacterales bacterium]|nr:hypothetical protein [Ktedonobacterales bacterium]